MFIPGNSIWLKIHMIANLLCVLLTIVVVTVAIAATNRAGSRHFDGTHQRIGLFIFIILLFQVIVGIFRPHVPNNIRSNDAKTDAAENNSNHDSSADVERQNNTPNGYNIDMEEKTISSSCRRSTAATVQKSPSRKVFEIGHRALGVALVILSIYNINTGLKLFATRYNQGHNDFTIVFWVWVGCFLSVLTFSKLGVKYFVINN